MTVREFWDWWTDDPWFARPKASSDIHRRERTKSFVARYGRLTLTAVDDQVVADWLRSGVGYASVMGARSMFNDAASIKAGRLVDRNPFEQLRLTRGPGRRHQQPPSERRLWEIVTAAREVQPSLAAWLQVAAFTGLRPGELDALRWDRILWERDRILVAEQFSAATRRFDTPKNHRQRLAPLTAPAREALESLPRTGEFCFVPTRGRHWTPSSRAYHWKAIRAAAGWNGTLYLATRHFAGWYMVNELLMSSEDVAIALGHTDGGDLVRRLYGHRDQHDALDRVVEAYAKRVSGIGVQVRFGSRAASVSTSPTTRH